MEIITKTANRYVEHGCGNCSLMLREEHKLTLLENRLLRKMVGCKREDGKECILRSVMICNLHIIVGRSNERG